MSVQDILNYEAIQGELSSSVTEDIDGNVLERLEYIANRAGGGGFETSGGGYYLIPAGPATGTTVTSGSADTYGSWVQMIASAAADLLIVGVVLDPPNATPLYCQLDIGTGAGGAETSRGELKIPTGRGNTNSVPIGKEFVYPIGVTSGTRIACRVADGTTAQNWGVTLICINVSDLASI